MLVHVIRVPQIEGGAKVVIEGDLAQDWVVFMLEKDITVQGARLLQDALNAMWIQVLQTGGPLPDLAGVFLTLV